MGLDEWNPYEGMIHTARMRSAGLRRAYSKSWHFHIHFSYKNEEFWTRLFAENNNALWYGEYISD